MYLQNKLNEGHFCYSSWSFKWTKTDKYKLHHGVRKEDDFDLEIIWEKKKENEQEPEVIKQ